MLCDRFHGAVKGHFNANCTNMVLNVHIEALYWCNMFIVVQPFCTMVRMIQPFWQAVELVPMVTRGDVILDTPLAKLQPLAGQGAGGH
jgi:hypothetical protein